MTKRSHPPTLLTLVERTVRDEALFDGARTVLVAVSGGPDSMALLSALARLAPKLRVSLVAHGIDHGLRAEAAAELDLAADLARSLAVPFATTRLAVPSGANLMARARTARLEALRNAARSAGASLLATGHHADDRAETVLMRLLRGTGPAGLAALPPRAGDLVRPMIRARRADVLAHLARHRIRFAEDPTNRDPRFLRSRVRHEALPLLAELSPRIVEHLCALADAASEGPWPPPAVPARLGDRPLSRAHRDLLARALRRRLGGVRVPLPGGGVAGVELATGEIVLIKD